MEVQTKRGVHFYFRLPETQEEVRSKIHHLGLPVDLLTGDRIAMGVGSEVDGFTYSLREGKELIAPSELPLFPLDILLVKKEVRASLETVLVSEFPEDRKVESARRALSRRFSIAGKNGDLALFKAACLLIQFYRFRLDTALALLIEWNEGPNVSPSWPLQRLEYKLREAQRLMK